MHNLIPSIPMHNLIPSIPMHNLIPSIPMHNLIPSIPMHNLIPSIPMHNLIPSITMHNLIPSIPMHNLIPSPTTCLSIMREGAIQMSHESDYFTSRNSSLIIVAASCLHNINCWGKYIYYAYLTIRIFRLRLPSHIFCRDCLLFPE